MRESNEAAEQLLIPPDVVELPEMADATLAAALLQGMLTIGQVVLMIFCNLFISS